VPMLPIDGPIQISKEGLGGQGGLAGVTARQQQQERVRAEQEGEEGEANRNAGPGGETQTLERNGAELRWLRTVQASSAPLLDDGGIMASWTVYRRRASKLCSVAMATAPHHHHHHLRLTADASTLPASHAAEPKSFPAGSRRTLQLSMPRLVSLVSQPDGHTGLVSWTTTGHLSRRTLKQLH